MLQTIDGKTVYVVDLEEIPELPVHGENPIEMAYAFALNDAITRGTIIHPGKYGIKIDFLTQHYDIYRIDEPLAVEGARTIKSL